MRKLFIAIFALSSISVRAQINLVLNPSFEQYSICPDQIDDVNYADYWMSLDSAWRAPDWIHDTSGGVPEFCHVCASNYQVSVPSNSRFYHYPRTGNGMMQLRMFCERPNDYFGAKDYLQGYLSRTLEIGHKYNVFFIRHPNKLISVQ